MHFAFAWLHIERETFMRAESAKYDHIWKCIAVYDHMISSWPCMTISNDIWTHTHICIYVYIYIYIYIHDHI